MSYDPEQYEILTSSAQGDAAFDTALANASATTLCRAVNYAWREFLDTETVINPIVETLNKDFGFTDDDIQAHAEGREPKGVAARSALGLPALPKVEDEADYDTRRWEILRHCPPSDQSLKSACSSAAHAELMDALAVRGRAGQKTAFALIRAEIVRRNTYSGLKDPVPHFEDYAAPASDSVPSVQPPSASVPPSEPSDFPMSETTSTYTLRDPNSLALHPCLDGMPELAVDDPKFQSLVADVRDRGFDYPAIIDEQDRVIDGRHRRRIAIMLRLELPTVRRAGADASEIILSTLLQRRHYTKGALAYMAAPLFDDVVKAGRARRIAALNAGANPRQSTQSTDGKIGKTLDELADELGFGRDLYMQAKKVRDKFDDETEYDWNDLPRPTTYKRYFEPKLLAGEIGLGGVLQAIAGKEATQGLAKITPKVATLFERGLQAFTTRFTTKWDKLSVEDRRPIVKSVATEVTKWPEDVRQATMNALIAAAKHKPADTAY